MTCRETSDHSILEGFPTVQVFFHTADRSVRAPCCSGWNAGERSCRNVSIPRSQPEPQPDTGTIPSTDTRREICR